MSAWYDRAIEGIEEDFENGNITQAELNKQMRELNEELQESEGKR